MLNNDSKLATSAKVMAVTQTSVLEIKLQLGEVKKDVNSVKEAATGMLTKCSCSKANVLFLPKTIFSTIPITTTTSGAGINLKITAFFINTFSQSTWVSIPNTPIKTATGVM